MIMLDAALSTVRVCVCVLTISACPSLLIPVLHDHKQTFLSSSAGKVTGVQSKMHGLILKPVWMTT